MKQEGRGKNCRLKMKMVLETTTYIGKPWTIYAFSFFVILLTLNCCHVTGDQTPLPSNGKKKILTSLRFLLLLARSPANLHFKPFNQALCTASQSSQRNSTGRELCGRGALARAHKAIFDDERTPWGNVNKLRSAPCGDRPGESQTTQSEG